MAVSEKPPRSRLPAWLSQPNNGCLHFRRSRVRFWLIIVLAALALEAIIHARSFPITEPDEPDEPFQRGCRVPDTEAPRANATIVMLARNEDLKDATHTIQSLEARFNRWFHYPVVFLNEKPFDDDFKKTMTGLVSGEVTFETLKFDMWNFPKWIDPMAARQSFKEQGERKILHAELESYHHMCRFFSGKMHDVPALQKYKWFWRVEPGVDFICTVTYDPFVEMEKKGKRYGYTMSLYEIKESVSSLFRFASEFKREHNIKSTALWNAHVNPSWLPWPFRSLLLRWYDGRNSDGDMWNLCHYWSNFEIADLDWMRSKEYREFFDYLDHKGGFFFERWGDAPVHSLAAALLLQPHEIHHFSDIGYGHPPFYTQPENAPRELQLPHVDLGDTYSGYPGWNRGEGYGCRCDSSMKAGTNLQTLQCLKKLGKAIGAGDGKGRWDVNA